MNKIIIAVFIFAIFSSCEKDINFDLKNAEDVLVVDANIENDRPPFVVLTRSLDFFSTLDPALLLNSFVRNADVTISNGVLTHKLKEYATELGGGVTVYSYGIDSGSLATAFTGQFNTRYTLNIKSEGKEFTAATSIPPLAKKADSMWWKTAPFADDTNNVVLMVRSTDPPGLGNYIRYFTSKNSGPFLPGENSVFDDRLSIILLMKHRLILV